MNKKLAKDLLSKIDDSLLSQESSQLLFLYLKENYPQKKIAEAMHIPISSAKQKIGKAMLELRKVSQDKQYIIARKILYGN